MYYKLFLHALQNRYYTKVHHHQIARLVHIITLRKKIMAEFFGSQASAQV